MARCAAIKRDGTRCGARAVTGYDQCFAHSPELAEKRKKATSKGGKTGGKGRPKDRMLTIHRTADLMITRLIREQIEPSIAAVVAQLLNVKIRAISTDLKIDEQLELVERMEEIEKALDERQKLYGTA
jgi:hypothetical protein